MPFMSFSLLGLNGVVPKMMMMIAMITQKPHKAASVVQFIATSSLNYRFRLVRGAN